MTDALVNRASLVAALVLLPGCALDLTPDARPVVVEYPLAGVDRRLDATSWYGERRLEALTIDSSAAEFSQPCDRLVLTWRPARAYDGTQIRVPGSEGILRIWAYGCSEPVPTGTFVVVVE